MPAMRYQPQGGARLATRNPLARGLTYLKSIPGNASQAVVGSSTATLPLGAEAKARGLATRFTGYGSGTVDTTNGVGQTAKGTVLVLHQSTLLPPNGGFPNPGYSHVLAATISGATSANGWLLMLGNGNGYLQFRAFDASDNGTQVAGADGTVPLNDGKPHTTVATWDLATGGVLATYVDGIPYANATLSSSAMSAQPMRLGRSRESQQFWGAFDGNMYLTAVWNRVLTPDEVKSVSANPWQMFESPYEEEEIAVATSVTASMAWAEADDTAAAAGIVTDRATAAWTEGSDTASMAGTVIDRAAAAWTEQDDSASLTGNVASRPPDGVAASVAWTEANDTASLTGQLLDRGSIAFTEQGDTWNLQAVTDFTLTARYADTTIMRFSRLQAVANLGPDRISQITGFP